MVFLEMLNDEIGRKTIYNMKRELDMFESMINGLYIYACFVSILSSVYLISRIYLEDSFYIKNHLHNTFHLHRKAGEQFA